ncbi:copper chaperone PCu(A)C [Polynucleobacter sp. MWH-Spelu-300-X4]|uniref:copper chaperone PCu(A)C n=1 Tax=Polynucleobacter sp. MWH-Spelu-300-X4 TaxID=2689109 RepID=UPI001BFCF1CF|nr:copper chaperone PCu(A)C [Polynucleobacter sp. MWH-Spelu-300-X4]QWD79181.1 copper chaperone PCu(A)C [Polynucleobacter sp. MWH-Spelu-300-X4]
MKKIYVVFLSLFMVATSAYADQEIKFGKLKIEDPYARATVPAQKAGGAFVKIKNTGAADKLIAVSSPVAKEMQLHTMSMEGNVMKMREVKAIDIPANGTVELQPGGFHLMLIDLKSQLKAGDQIPVKLKFEKAGELEVKFQVKDMRPAHGQPGHDHSKDHQ